ncbi:hypothetical protein AMELA_G00132130 [Ameiurus melas]|uniref:Uncharacterized protein n=1 Tax=Ameiurus melas TaxID=219545 RepID=A0A7J6ALN7_AMEME|nr:hypothetical protein AMELA_G00132130 [Ameiurus melas]
MWFEEQCGRDRSVCNIVRSGKRKREYLTQKKQIARNKTGRGTQRNHTFISRRKNVCVLILYTSYNEIQTMLFRKISTDSCCYWLKDVPLLRLWEEFY